MRVLVFILWGFVSGLGAQKAWADWLNPTSGADCKNGISPLRSEMYATRQQAHQCFRDTYPSPGNGPHDYRPVCGDPPRPNVPACANLERHACKLEAEAEKRTSICRARLAEHRAREAALRAQQQERERLLREQERIAGGDGPGTQFPLTSEQISQRLYGQLPNGPANFADSARIAGHGLAQLRGIRMTGQSGAYALSSAMSIVGNRVIGGLNQRVFGELENALQDFNAGNPRPTVSQLEEFYARRSELAGQYATHMTRVQNTDYNLPLDAKSVVTGSYAGIINQLVHMRNAGEIDEPIAALGAAAATFLAARAYRDAEERVIGQSGRDFPQVASAEELRERRQAILKPLRAKRIQFAQPSRPVTPSPATETPRKPAIDCLVLQVKVDFDNGSITQLVNGCKQTIECQNHPENPVETLYHNPDPQGISRTDFIYGPAMWCRYK